MQPEDLLGGDIRLVSLPSIVAELNLMVATGSSRDIGNLIAKDAALTARLLRIANSGFYGQSGNIRNLQQAIALVGTRELVNLVMATVAASRFAAIRQDLVDMDSFGQRAAYMSVAADTLGHLGRAQEKSWLFVAGLLHDIGSLVLYSVRPSDSQEILLRSSGSPDRVAELEHERYGFTFADVGAALARRWKLPDAVPHLIQSQLWLLPSAMHDHDSRIMRMARCVLFASLAERSADEAVARIADEAGTSSLLIPETDLLQAYAEIPERTEAIYGSLF
ncbi:MAG: HDOD domain-containing protein [Methylococcaceae bacterium]|nr:HDOD domain-containing protein [Methylococcaceae bacterium]